MKKIITLLCVSFFTLVSCSSEDVPVTVPSATAAQAVLEGGSIIVTWPDVTGTGITYNVYRNDNPIKINATPLTEAKFTDVLTATGSYTYTITVNLLGLESPKGIASGKVVLDLPKTTTFEEYNYSTIDGVTTTTTYKNVSVLTYDSANITKLISISGTSSNTGNTTVSKSKEVYIYSGNLIKKVESFDVAGVFQNSTMYIYDDKNKIKTSFFTTNDWHIAQSLYVYNPDGTVTSTQFSAASGASIPTGNTTVYTFLNGNLVKDVNSYTSTNYNSTSTRVCLFDAKNNPTKNILGFSNLFGETANLNNSISSVYTYSSNNSTTSSTTATRSEFTYDANGNVLTEKVFSKQDNAPEKLSSTTTYTY
jgi:hypothetical protein